MDRTLKSVNFFNSSSDEGTVCVYEVFRVEQFKPLFLEDHLERLQNSLEVAGFHIHLNQRQLSHRLNMLLSANNIANGNIKLDYKLMPNGEQAFQAYYVPTDYPGGEERKNGIKCSLQFSERHHPTAKIYNPEVRGKANTIIEQRHVHETILVNHDNNMTEGSRSNLFFIKGDDLITANDSIVLPGIMRKQIISIAKSLNINIEYRTVSVEELNQMDAAFISGTSPRMLPIEQLDKINYPVDNPVFIRLLKALDELIIQQLK